MRRFAPAFGCGLRPRPGKLQGARWRSYQSDGPGAINPLMAATYLASGPVHVTAAPQRYVALYRTQMLPTLPNAPAKPATLGPK